MKKKNQPKDNKIKGIMCPNKVVILTNSLKVRKEAMRYRKYQVNL